MTQAPPKVTWQYVEGLPTLRAKKVLAARTMAAKMFSKRVFVNHLDFGSNAARHQYHEILENLVVPNQAEDDGVSLEEFLIDRFNMVLRVADGSVQAKLKQLHEYFIARLITDCPLGKSDGLCASDHDCGDQLSNLLNNVCMLAEHAYRDALDGIHVLPDIRISVDPVIGDRSVRDVHFYARTNAEKGEDVHLSITLKLTAHTLDSRYLLQLHALLFHEVFVHVFQGVLQFPQRSNCGQECVFTEGVIDAVGRRVLQRGLRSKSWRYHHAAYAEALELTYIEEVENWHEQRVEPINSGPATAHLKTPEIPTTWSFGSDAVDKLEQSFMKIGDNQHTMERALMLLNASVTSEADRKYLSEFFGKVGTSEFRDNIGVLRTALSYFLEYQDIELFFKTLKKIKFQSGQK